MRSNIEDFLPPEGRDERHHQDTGCSPLLSADQIAGVRMKALTVHTLPASLRTEAMNRIGREYGISRRTVYRYMQSHTFEVVVDGWRAMFTVTDKRPRQSSPWVKS